LIYKFSIHDLSESEATLVATQNLTHEVGYKEIPLEKEEEEKKWMANRIINKYKLFRLINKHYIYIYMSVSYLSLNGSTHCFQD